MSYLLNQKFKYTFEVKKILKRKDNGSSFLEVKTILFDKEYGDNTKFKSMKLIGTFPVVFEGDTFSANICIRENHKYGYFLEVISDLLYVLPHTKKELISFLRKKVSTLKKEEAEEIIKFGGSTTISKLVKTPEIFFNKTTLSKTRIVNLKKSLDNDVFFETLMTFMQTLELSASTANYIYQQFGIQSISKIKNNPYHICQISEITFTQADSIAEKFNLKFNDTRRIKSAILEYLNTRANKQGDVCVEKQELFHELHDFLNRVGVYSADVKLEEKDIEKAYIRLLDKEKLYEVVDKNKLTMTYLTKMYTAETSIIKNINTMLHTPASLLSSENIETYVLNHKDNDIIQNRAIKMALTNRISILTGGPGTGKTHTVNGIIECLHSFKPNAKVLQLSPTGRAASKMSEVTGLPACTIHKAIGLRPTNSANLLSSFYSKKEQNEKVLEEDLIIVDEASMIDIQVFAKLLDAVSSDTSLLIVGDENQLSSVGPGLVLRDLIASEKLPVTILQKIFRQSQQSQIVMNSYKLKSGIKSTDVNGLSFDNKKGDFYFIERESIDEIASALIEMTLRTIKNKKYKIWDILLLSPIKDDILGVFNLNRELQKVINPASDDKNDYMYDSLTIYREEDKVINTLNNEENGVSNGDIGKIIDIYYDAINLEVDITVEFFNGQCVHYYREDLKNLELAYCITTHKSQGTESKVVIMPISAAHYFCLNKRSVYTGWTRAKEMVLCVGDLETLDAIADKEETKRNSLLKERLMIL